MGVAPRRFGDRGVEIFERVIDLGFQVYGVNAAPVWNQNRPCAMVIIQNIDPNQGILYVGDANSQSFILGARYDSVVYPVGDPTLVYVRAAVGQVMASRQLVV